ncbi:hypothetical protein CPB85DRAFT_1324685 [Mucidula mucida]|nr:hypothetical protein CPB85DRAFT_1324685 [Mucidula mucida]
MLALRVYTPHDPVTQAHSEGAYRESRSTPSPSLYPSSLRDAEKALVKTNVTVLEAKAVSWLLTGTSNSSVHCVVLHALSNVPLQSVSIIKQLVGQKTVEDFLKSALKAPEYSTVGQRLAYERLTRARVLLCPTATFMSAPSVQDFSEDFLPCLLSGYHRTHTTEFLRRELVHPSALLDVASWTRILQNVMSAGANWLDIGSETSPVWQEFLTCFLQAHTCPDCAQRRGSVGEVYSVRCIVNPAPLRFLNLTVVLDPLLASTTVEPITLRKALGHFLIPSFSHIVYTLAFPSLCTGKYYDTIPSDIRLRLAMLQSSSIQRTSLTDDDDEITFIGITPRQDTPHLYHPDILRATFLSVVRVVDETFQADTLCSQDKKQVLQVLFRILILDYDLREDYAAWITDERATTIIQAIFVGPVDFIADAQLIADTLEVAVRTQCTVLLSKLYPELCRQDWLKDISDQWFENDVVISEPQTQTAHYFAAAVFVRGISVILAQEARGPIAVGTLKYVCQPRTLLILCKLLVLADVETRKEIGNLYPLISEQLWMSCLIEMHKFRHSPRTAAFYAHQLEHRPHHPYEPTTNTLVYDPFRRLFTEFLNLTGASRERYPHLISLPCTANPLSELLPVVYPPDNATVS